MGDLRPADFRIDISLGDVVGIIRQLFFRMSDNDEELVTYFLSSQVRCMPVSSVGSYDVAVKCCHTRVICGAQISPAPAVVYAYTRYVVRRLTSTSKRLHQSDVAQTVNGIAGAFCEERFRFRPPSSESMLEMGSLFILWKAWDLGGVLDLLPASRYLPLLGACQLSLSLSSLPLLRHLSGEICLMETSTVQSLGYST